MFPKCQKCNSIGWCNCNIKTIHENKVMINPPIDSPPTMIEILNNLEKFVLSLDRYDNEWGYITKQDKGQYILLEDVLALFSAKK